MARLEIARLRKDHGMSQNELARELQITQSFLSAIENGKSPLPPEKEGKLLEIFNLPDLGAYISDASSGQEMAKKMSEMTDSDLFNQLLQRFHQQAHSKEEVHHHHDHHERIDDLSRQVQSLFDRNERLMTRNDELAASNDRLRAENDTLRATADSLRAEIDKLRSEIFRLKSN